MNKIAMSCAVLAALLLLPGCPLLCPGTGENILTFNNNSSYTIMLLQVAPCATLSMGVDQLDGEPLLPGESISVTQLADGCWQYYAEDDEGGFWENTDISFSGGVVYNVDLTDKKGRSEGAVVGRAVALH